jgi:hypothetical protein
MNHDLQIWRSANLSLRCPCLEGTKSERLKHHIRYFGRFPVSQFNDSLDGVDL